MYLTDGCLHSTGHSKADKLLRNSTLYHFASKTKQLLCSRKIVVQ